MQDLQVFFNNLVKLSINQILIVALIMLGFFFIDKIVVDKLLKFIFKIVKKTDNVIDDKLIKALQQPIKLFVFGIGIYVSLRYINIDTMPSEMLSSSKYLKILLVITICIFTYNLTLENSLLSSKPRDENSKENGVVFPFVAIIIRMIIIIAAISIIAHEFGLTGFLTGLGVSGIVVALAAQDTCANLFGGMMIVLDKSFGIGDWIQTDSVEGIVEGITFRSTRIRTFSNSIVTVPNSKLTNNNIINLSKRESWRVCFKLNLDINTKSSEISEFVYIMETMIRNTDGVNKDLVVVKFNEITSCSFVIFVYFYTGITDFLEYENLKQEINLKTLIILEEKGIKMNNSIFSIDNIKR